MDVKPKNVIMAARPSLIDLGMARTAAEIRELDGPIGTTAYMSPEQCHAETICTFGPPGDVWGLGVTLYEAATRALPFTKSTDEDVYPQTHVAPVPLPGDVPRPLADLVMSALAYEPADRPTARDLTAELARLSEL
jgi:serine/threonine-protein kinase